MSAGAFCAYTPCYNLPYNGKFAFNTHFFYLCMIFGTIIVIIIPDYSPILT